MPLPSAASFTQVKWLAFFAALTAKLTHHNALVVMEGAELLKRVLLSRVSIAAIVQQGDLLVRLLDTWRGCVLSERARGVASSVDDARAPPHTSAAVALNDELAFVLAESISQCIDLMVSLHADGDPYYCLLVLARAGPMLEVLVDVLQAAPPQLFGITASLLQQLLALPLGRDVVVAEAHDGDVGEAAWRGLDATVLASLQASVPLQRHISVLAEAVQEHGALLQHTTDTLAKLLGDQHGPRRLAAVALFNQASRRLRKHELRRGRVKAAAAAAASTTSAAHSQGDLRESDTRAATDDSDLNVTITGAAPAGRRLSSSPSPDAVTPCALDDLEVGLRSQALQQSGGAPVTHTAAQPPPSAAARSPSPNAVPPSGAPASPCRHDISAAVDAEPPRIACVVPLSMAEETLRHLAACRSHDSFFDAFDWLWCVTVADAAAVGAALTQEVLRRSLGRYLAAAPRTRRDRLLFTFLLLWIGHMHSVSALREEAHRCVLDIAAATLLPMLRAELADDSEHVHPWQQRPTPHGAEPGDVSLNISAITPPTQADVTAAANVALPSASASTAGLPGSDAGAASMVAGRRDHRSSSALLDAHHHHHCASGGGGGIASVSGSALLPYATARKAQEAAVLLRPSIAVILLSFLLNIRAGATGDAHHSWVTQGGVLAVAQMAVRRAQGCRSALLDTPTNVDGALSDEVYLDYALRCVRTDASTVAVLGCRLVAAVLGDELRRDAPAPSPAAAAAGAAAAGAAAGAASPHRGDDGAAVRAEVALAAESLLPLLADIAVLNPDVAAAQESGAASPVHHVPLNLRCTRYTSLGECALTALDACLQYHARTGHLRSRGDVPMGVAGFAVEDLVRVLPSLTRVAHCSVHPPVRAVPYRLLLCVSRRAEEVLLVLRHTPSLASAAVARVLDYGPRAAQWEAAAAAEWLTVLVDVVADAERTTTATTTAATTAARVGEFFHFDYSPMSLQLLTTVASSRRSTNTGSAYAVNALLQLAVHLQCYLQERYRRVRRSSSSPSPPPAVAPPTLPLCPAGATSVAQWAVLLRGIAADNRRLARISAAAKRASAEAAREMGGDGGVARDAWSRAVTAAEQIALQYTFTGTVFHALDTLLRGVDGAALHVDSTIPALVCDAVAAALTVPTPSDVVELLSRRFHTARTAPTVAGAGEATDTPSPLWAAPAALLRGFQAAVQWASRVGASWLSGAYGRGAARAVGSTATAPVLGGLPALRNSAAFVEDVCGGALATMQAPSPGVSSRTRCLAAVLLSALVDVCPAELTCVLEARGPALFAAAAALQRFPCVSGLQCRLLRRVRSAAVYAATSAVGWVDRTTASLQRAIAGVAGQHAGLPRSSSKESSRRPAAAAAAAARDVQHCHVLISLLASLVSTVRAADAEDAAHAPAASPGAEDQHQAAGNAHLPQTQPPLLDGAQRQALCSALCDAIRVEPLLHTVVLAVRSMTDADEGRRCLLTDIASAGDPLGRSLFGRVVALTLRVPNRWSTVEAAAAASGLSGRACSPTSTPQDRHRRLRSASAHRQPHGTEQTAAAAVPSSSSPAQPRSPSRGGEAPLHADHGAVCAVGCDILAALCGRRSWETATAAAASSCSSTSSSAFLSAFLKHRGMEYLSRAVVEVDRTLRRRGRAQAMPLHWLRLIAALSSHVSVARSVVQESDLFDILLELAGAPLPPQPSPSSLTSSAATAATLALLALRNVCFADGLKAVLCQDARLLLTLKAAGMGLAGVWQLVGQHRLKPPPPPPQQQQQLTNAKRLSAAAGTARHEFALRDDVIDMANKTEVDWATQVCTHARGAGRVEEAAPASPHNSGGGAVAGRGAASHTLGDITNRDADRAAAGVGDGSLLGADGAVSDGGRCVAGEAERAALAAVVPAADTEAPRRRYLAATALVSLWFDNQRGRSAIAGVLATVPCWSLAEVRAVAEAAALPPT
ncbi:hypothetical protein NESM_000338800 [Novymonas esmeraldas]|uniref:Uncharacterized protein n=1 Tax=Novymonas esmeraldas TaxID=1808958 RepID=A0AAW0EMV4_9TRYP